MLAKKKDSQKTLRVAVLDDYFSKRDYKDEQLEYIIMPFVDMQEISKALAYQSPDFVIISSDYYNPYYVAKEILSRHKLTILMSVNNADLQTWRKAISCGIKGLITKPISYDKIKAALLEDSILEKNKEENSVHVYIDENEKTPPRGAKIRKENNVAHVDFEEIREIREKVKPTLIRNNSEQGRIFTFYNTKGGVGKTLFSVNTSVFIKRLYPGKKVALVDFDLDFGDVANFLGVEPKVTGLSWQHLPDENLTNESVERYLIKHPSGIWLLPAPIPPIDEETFSYKIAEKILVTLKKYFDVIIVDLGPTLRDVTVVTLDHANHIFLVSTSNASSLRNIYDLTRILNGLKIPKEKASLILNNFRRNVDISEINKYIPYKIAMKVPELRKVRDAHDGYALAVNDKRFKIYLEELCLTIVGKKPTPRGLFSFLKRGERS